MERLFLIKGDIPFDYLDCNKYSIEQAYLSGGEVRVRRTSGPKYSMTTYDRDSSGGFKRTDQKISMENYNLLYNARQSSTIRKTRYNCQLDIGGQPRICEIDIYDGRQVGLRIVRVHFFSEEEAESFNSIIPSWFGEEVTDDVEYRNCNLAAVK